MKKRTINEDHIPVHKYELRVANVTLNFVSVSGLEEELDTVELPDRTVASGGRTGPVEIVAAMPAHHQVEQAFMEQWFLDAQDPVLPTYKRPTTLTMFSLTGAAGRSYTFPDMFPTKRADSDREAGDPGEMATVEWTLKASDSFVLPVS